MSEKCKTCTHFQESPVRKCYGSCEILPRLIDMSHFDRIWLSGEFGCHAHVPKPEKPEVVDLWVKRRLLTGKLTIELYSELQQSDWDAVQAFMQDVRIARKTEKRPV